SDDFVSGAHLALFEHAEIEPRALVRDQQGRHPGLIHADADTVAGHARLGDFKQRPADPIAVADADLAVGQAFHSEVLSELPEGEVTSLQLTLPVAIRIHLVDEDGALFSTVTVQITLRVTIDVEPPNQAPSLHGLFPHGRVHYLPAPCDLPGTTHVDRQQPCHTYPFAVWGFADTQRRVPCLKYLPCAVRDPAVTYSRRPCASWT